MIDYPKLIIPFEGRIPSFKNSKQIFAKPGRKAIVIPNKKAKTAMEDLAAAATYAVKKHWYGKPLPAKTPFTVELDVYVTQWTAPDIDGSLSTVLDSLNGIVYDDDRYCQQSVIRKHVSKDNIESAAIIISPANDALITSDELRRLRNLNMVVTAFLSSFENEDVPFIEKYKQLESYLKAMELSVIQ